MRKSSASSFGGHFEASHVAGTEYSSNRSILQLLGELVVGSDEQVNVEIGWLAAASPTRNSHLARPDPPR